MSFIQPITVPRILRLQPELGGMLADNMDILSLTRWRLTCKTNYDQAVASLRRSLLTLLTLFVSKPILILDIITRHRSVIGGEFALAFILRDPSILSNTLDIYSTDYEFDSLCTSVLDNPTLNRTTIHHEYSDLGVLDALRTLVSRVLVIHTSLGTTIRVHRSYTSSATAPISHASSTALSNFVTAYGFGCSHPALTLKRRALVADQELPHLPISDPTIHDHLIRHDFSLAFSPTAWTEYRRHTSTWNCAVERDLMTGPDATIVGVSCAVGGARGNGVNECLKEGVLRNTSKECFLALGDGGASADELELAHQSGIPGHEAVGNRVESASIPGSSNDEIYGQAVSNSRAKTPRTAPVSSHYRGETVGTACGASIIEMGRLNEEHCAIPSPVTGEEQRSDANVGVHLPSPGLPSASTGFTIPSAGAFDPITVSTGIVSLDRVPEPAVDCEGALDWTDACDHMPSLDALTVDLDDACSVDSGPTRSDYDGPVVGRGMYRYAGDDDSVLSTCLSVDLDPIGHLDRTFYLKGFGYKQAVEVGTALSGEGSNNLIYEPRLPRTTVDSTSVFGDGVEQPSQEDSVSDLSPGLATDMFISHTDDVALTVSTDRDDVDTEGIISDVESPTVDDTDAVDSLSEGTGASSRSDTPEDNFGTGSTETIDSFFKPEECWRERYLCPSQGRFFGDRGSFVDFFDPLRGGEEFCAQNNVAPFGPMIVWRVLSAFSCEGGCDIYEDAIDAGVPPIPLIVRRDPFAHY